MRRMPRRAAAGIEPRMIARPISATSRTGRRRTRSTQTPANRLSSRKGANSNAPSRPIWAGEAARTSASASGIASWLISLPKRAIGWHPSTLARRGAGALALWSFLGQRISGGVYRAGRVVSLPTQLGLRFPPDLLRSYISRPRAHVAAYRTKAELSLTFDARPWLAEIECPAFVLVGPWDRVVPASAGRDLARQLPNATLHSLRGGHLVHLVQAARVGALIQAWARRVHVGPLL